MLSANTGHSLRSVHVDSDRVKVAKYQGDPAVGMTFAQISRITHRSGRRHLVGAWIISAATSVLLLVGVMLGGEPAWAQLNDNAVISTDGTQFVQPPPAPPPTTPRKREPAPPSPPPAAVRQSPPKLEVPAAPAAPARFPTVFLLLDTSDSMLNKVPGKNVTQLDEAKVALEGVLAGMSPQTQVQLWSFNTRMWPIQAGNVPAGRFVSLSQKGMRKALIGKVRRIKAMGGTNLYNAVVRALGYFSDPAQQARYRSGERFPVLVVVSDGEDSGLTRENLETVLATKKKFPLVTVNTIGFKIKGDSDWFGRLCQIATDRTGCATADDQDQLRKLLESFYKPRES